MTKIYNDIEAVTKLLEEKEKDLELAARIGQSLLKQNKVLTSRNEELENELIASNESTEKIKLELIYTSERVIQLQHDLSMKNGLLQIYTEVEAEESEFDLPKCHSSDDKSSILTNWEQLHQKVQSLEEENLRVRTELITRANDIELEERKELQLIHDCAKQLTEANLQILNFQEEVGRKGEDNIRQQEEITNLVSQIVDLQKKVREQTVETDTLQNALQVSHECQNELSLELIEIKEKYGTLLAAFHELQTEFKKRSRLNTSHCAFMPFTDSLASEIESTLGSEECDSEISGTFARSKKKTAKDEMRCYSPDSVLSGESYNFRHNTPHSMATHSQRPFYFPDKLQIVKPLEGSITLKQWQKLATPHLGVILEKFPVVPNKAIKDLNTELLDFVFNSSYDYISESNCNINFVTTNSIFTYTTTSLSKTTDSTNVTPSFSKVQLSTGLQSPISTASYIIQSCNSAKTYCERISNSLVDSTEKMKNTVMTPTTNSPSLEISDVSPSNSFIRFQNTNHSNDMRISESITAYSSFQSAVSSHISVQNPINNKSLENHSKDSLPPNNIGLNDGLIGMSFVNSNSKNGIITKCSHSIGHKLKNLENQKPNSLKLEKCSYLSNEWTHDRGDIGVIKTLRKGGFV